MRARLVSAVIIVLLLGAVVAGSYVLIQERASTTSTAQAECANLASVTRTKLGESQFGSVTSFDLPSPLRSPNSIMAAPDGSVWFGEVAIPGLAHLFLNGTLVEYPWPFSNSTPASLCFDRSEIWGVEFWNGLVWASDPANNQLVGMNQTTGAFTVIPLGSSVLPRFIAVDPGNNLWFTETSKPAQIGVVQESSATPIYYSVPAAEGAYTTSILFENSSLGYVVTVNPEDNHGQVFSFDPLSPVPVFTQVGDNQTLLGPYSVAVSQGGIWVGEHEASYVAFLDSSSGQWSFYPTSTDPKLPLTLPYYLLANGSSVWFNEHDANRVAELTNRTSLTEYAMSQVPIDKVGIGNALTIALDRNLVWFTAWTDNRVGYVNDSITPPFSVSSPSSGTVTKIAAGSSGHFTLDVAGASSVPLNVTFADSESISSVPNNISFAPDVSSIPHLDGPAAVQVTVNVSFLTHAGVYLLLMTVTDGLTSRSVYVPLQVT
jgi:streptogramin lyase